MKNNEEQPTSAQEQEENSVESASELDLLKKELDFLYFQLICKF